jgi:DNA-directed RNA polymerase subunit RPC12/RpoP
MISFPCSSCAKTIETDDFMGGRQHECPHCGKKIYIPNKVITTEPRAAGAPSEVPIPAPEVPPIEAIQDVPRCGRCGAIRRGEESKCSFCGAKFEAAAPAPELRREEAAPGERRRGLLLAGLFVGALACAGGALAFFMGGESVSAPTDELCRGNLRSLYDALRRYEQRPEGLPKSVGKEFWIEIAGKESVPTAVECPAVDRKGAGRTSDFRGPARPWAQLPPGAVVAADLPDNHRDGMNVLLKNGEIEFAPVGSPLHQRALEETRD